MQENKRKQMPDFCALLWDGTVPAEVSSEEVLPEYLPDIRRLLRVTDTPAVTGKYMNGEEIEIEGTVNTVLLYLSEENTVQSIRFSAPFTMNIPVKGLNEHCTVSMQVTADNAASGFCRLTGPRKMTFHHRLKAIVRAVTEENAAPKGLTPTVCTYTETIPVCRIQTASGDTLRYVEDISLGCAAKEILDCTVTGVPADVQIADGTATCRGEYRIHILYLCENSGGTQTINTITKSVPFSETLTGENLTDTPDTETEVTVSDVRYTLSEDGGSIALDFAADISLFGCERGETVITTDAFSTTNELSETRRTETVLYPVKAIRTTVGGNSTIALDGGDTPRDIADTRILPRLSLTAMGNGKAVFDGTASVSAIIRTESNSYLAANGSMPLHMETDIPASVSGELPLCHVFCTVSRVSAQIEVKNENTSALQIHAEVTADGLLLSGNKTDYIAEVTVGSPKASMQNGYPLILYYPQDGDTVWSISKSHSISPAAIRRVNELGETDEAIPDDKNVLLLSYVSGDTGCGE